MFASFKVHTYLCLPWFGSAVIIHSARPTRSVHLHSSTAFINEFCPSERPGVSYSLIRNVSNTDLKESTERLVLSLTSRDKQLRSLTALYLKLLYNKLPACFLYDWNLSLQLS